MFVWYAPPPLLQTFDQEEKGAKKKSSKKGDKDEPGPALKLNKTKDKREAAAKKNRWPVPPDNEPPGAKEGLLLKELWEKVINDDALDAFFPKKEGSMECGNDGYEKLEKCVQKQPQTTSCFLGNFTTRAFRGP